MAGALELNAPLTRAVHESVATGGSSRCTTHAGLRVLTRYPLVDAARDLLQATQPLGYEVVTAADRDGRSVTALHDGVLSASEANRTLCR